MNKVWITEAPYTEETGPEEKAEQSKPLWRRPQLERLQVSLDTALSVGSNDDAAGRPTLA